MTFSSLTLSAVLLSALALPAMAQGTAQTHPVAPAASTSLNQHPAVAHPAAPTSASAAKPDSTSTVTKPETTMAGPAQTKPATVKPN